MSETVFTGTATTVVQEFTYTETQNKLKIVNDSVTPININVPGSQEGLGFFNVTINALQTWENEVDFTAFTIFTDNGTADFTATVTNDYADNADIETQIKSLANRLTSPDGNQWEIGNDGTWSIVILPPSLVWSDEFTDSIINTQNWSYELGFVRNNELQDYTDLVANSFIRNGKLILKAIKDENGDWTSSSLLSNNKFELGNGRLEASIKLPNEVGVFPAFWCVGSRYQRSYEADPQYNLGDSWAKATEVDIMEKFGFGNTTTCGIWYKENPDDTVPTKDGSTSFAFDSTVFNVYAMEKDDNEYRFYVNDVLIKTATITDEDNKQPMYPILNFAIGSAGGQPDGTTPDEMEMEIDYVRYYTLSGEPVTLTAIALNKTTITENVGYTERLDIGYTPATANIKTIVWTSSDESVATVYEGHVTLVGEGTATLTAEGPGGIIASCFVTSSIALPATVLVSDSFDRADGVVGNPDIGPTPVQEDGTFNISSNKLIPDSGNSGAAFITWGGGEDDVIVECDITFGSYASLSLRYQDKSNHYRVRMSASNNIKLFSIVDNSATEISVYDVTPSIGQVYNFKVVLNGSSIKLYLDDILVIDVVDSTFLTGGANGIYSSSATANDIYDNFTIKTL